jgi:hypothetical protein
MRVERKTPASAVNEYRGEIEEQISKTYYQQYTLIASNSQYATRWLSSNYHLFLPVADFIFGLAGLGGKR